MFCPKCGSFSKEDEKFCPNCGTPVGNQRQETAATVQKTIIWI